MNDNEFELPPVDANTGSAPDIAEQQPPVKQQGSERNPEYLPPVSQDDPVMQPSSSAPAVLTKNDDNGSKRASSMQADTSLLGASPQIADDVDLIEKEWVEKAKEIVEKTKDNPYLQNKAISEIKAEYIQKRYSKKISRSED